MSAMRLQVFGACVGFALALGCAPVAIACSRIFPGHWETLKSARTIEGFRFPAGTEVQVLNDGNKATGVVVLHRKVLLDGHWLQPATRLAVGAAKRGAPHVQSFTSEPGQTVSGIRLPAGSFVQFDAQGRLASINEYGGTVRDEKATIRVRGLTFLSSAGISFYPDGHVKSGALTQAFSAPGLRVDPASVTFFANGRIASAQGDYDTVVQAHGVKYSGRQVVQFHPNGRVKWGEALQDFVAGGLRVRKGYTQFHADGTLERGDVAQAFVACGLHMNAGVTEFHADGCIKSGNLAQSIVRQGLHLLGGYNVGFYPNGSVASGRLAQATVIHGVRVEPDTPLELYPDGRVQSRYASQPFVAHGVPLAAGIVKLFPDGSVERGGVAHATTVRGLHIAPGAIEFYPDGRIKTANAVGGSLYRGMQLNGTRASPLPHVQLAPDGALQNPPHAPGAPSGPPPVC